MFIEKLNKDDFDVLALLLIRYYDFKTNVKNVNKDTLRLTIKQLEEKDIVFMIQDFRVIPACEQAADLFINQDIEDTFFRFMKQKFGYPYLNSLSKHIANNLEEVESNLQLGL